MCDPTTMAALAVASAGVSALGAYRETQAANQATEYNAQVAENNATIARQNQALEQQRSADAIRRGELEEKQHRLQVAGQIGQQKSALAGSGVVVGQGSALDTLQDTAKYGEMDALTLRYNAQLEAWGSDVQASNYATQAGTLSSQAGMLRNGKKSPLMSAGTTLLTQSSSMFAGSPFSGGL